MFRGGGWGAGLKMSIHEECALETSIGFPTAAVGAEGWKKEKPEIPPTPDVALADLASADVETGLSDLKSMICCGEIRPSGPDARSMEGPGLEVGSVDDRPALASPTPSVAPVPADAAGMVPAWLPPAAAACTADASDDDGGASTTDDEEGVGNGGVEAPA